MKTQIKNYTFNKATKQITFTDYSLIRLDCLLLITNVTDGIIIFNFADPTKKGTVAGNVLTLQYDTTSMDNGDSLQIFYENDLLPASDEKQGETNILLQFLKRLGKIMESQSVVDILGRQRVTVDAVTPQVNVLPSSYPVAGSYSNFPAIAVTNGSTVYWQPTWAGPVDPRWTNIQNARLAYNTGIRSKLINS